MRLPMYTYKEIMSNIEIIQPNINYTFRIVAVEDTISKNNNEMTIVKFEVDGVGFLISDFFMLLPESDDPKKMRARFFQLKRIMDFVEAVGVQYSPDCLSEAKLKNHTGIFTLTKPGKYWEVNEYVKKDSLVYDPSSRIKSETELRSEVEIGMYDDIGF